MIIAQKWLTLLTLASAVLTLSTVYGFAQNNGIPILSRPAASLESDRDGLSFTSSGGLASPLPLAMTPNSFSGALNVSVSIAVPGAKGRAMPPLALTYDSMRGWGTLGVGWTLTAGSIVRNRRFGIDYAGDSFVVTLGSQSVDLIDIGGGIYRDKLDTLRLEAKQVTSTPGVFSWLVTDAFGTKYYFGSAEGSRRQAVNGAETDVSEWHLDRIEDLSGNYSTLEYRLDSGFVYLKEVVFTGNTVVPLEPHNRIAVSYESRPAEDITTSFATNHESRTALRVNSIDVTARGLAYASYVFSYRQSAETKRSLLTGITRTVPGSVQSASPSASTTPDSSPPAGSASITTATFAYSDWRNTDHWIVDGSDGPNHQALMNHQCLPGDFNGDGKTDLLCATNAAGDWRMGISRRASMPSNSPGNHRFSGFDTTAWQGPAVAKTLTFSVPRAAFSSQPEVIVTVPDIRSSCFTGDFNGDNKTDVGCYAPNNEWQLGISTGAGFQVKASATGPTLASGKSFGDHCIAGDFNGDGLTDAACLVSGAAGSGRWSVALTKPIGRQTSDFWEAADWLDGAAPPADMTAAASCRAGDFNGDRRTDIACYESASNTWYVSISTGHSFSTQPWPANSETQLVPGSEPILSRCVNGDFNGDGKTDLACHIGVSDGKARAGSWWVLLSTGSSWKTARWTGPPIMANDGNVSLNCFTGEFNGDWKSDIACHAPAGVFFDHVPPGSNSSEFWGWWIVSVAGSESFLTSEVKLGELSEQLGPFRGYGSCMASDFDGDAKTDLLCDYGAQTDKYELSSTDNHDIDLLTGTSTGTGLTASFDYSSSSEQPLTSIGFPLPVVASMSLNAGATVSQKTYEYENGAFQRQAREFRGFNHVKITRSKTEGEHQRIDDIWFFQGEGLNANEPGLPHGLQDLAAGNPYYRKVSDGPKQLFASNFKYEARPVSTGGPNVARLVENRTSVYEDPVSHPDRIQTFAYDINGNVTEEADTDLKSGGGESLRLRAAYSNDLALHALAYPLTMEVSDREHSRLQYAAYGYDESTCASQPKARSFMLTSVNRWIDDRSTAHQRLGYGASGNLTCVEDSYGGLTSLAYDSDAEYVTSIKNPLSHQNDFTYYGIDGVSVSGGLPGLVRTAATNKGEDVTQYDYDPAGRLRRLVRPDSSSIGIEYNNVGDPNTQNVRMESSVGLAYTVYSDGLGRPYRFVSTGPGGRDLSVTRMYDSAGNVVAVDEPRFINGPTGPVQPSQAKARMEYDALGRLLAATDSTGRTIRQCFDGLRSIGLDGEGHARRMTSDMFGRPVTFDEFDGKFANCDDISGHTSVVTTNVKYDGLGRMLRIAKGGVAVTEAAYDGLGDLRSIKNADKGDSRFRYDLAGRLTGVDRPGRRPVEYIRDPVGRLKTVRTRSVCGEGDVWSLIKRITTRCGGRDEWNFEYDLGPHAEGRLTGIKGDGFAAKYEYDARGNNTDYTTRIDGDSYALQRQYDAAGRISGIDYPDGRHIAYKYDGPVLASITDNNRPVAVARDFNAYLQPSRVQFGNGAGETFDYGLGHNISTPNQNPCATVPSGELCRISASLGDNPFRSILYRFDKESNVLGISDSVDGTKSFTYDGLDRLTGELAARGMEGDNVAPAAYAYDPLGRRTSTSFQGAYQYGRDTPAERPSTPTSVGADRVESDIGGNIIRIGGRRYDFDTAGQLAKVTTPEHRQVSYSYDWQGNLIRKKTRYKLPWGLIKWEHATVTFPNPYLICQKNHCDDLVIGYGRVLAKLTPEDAEYYHLDRLGTRFAVTTSEGRLKSSLSYSAYGIPAEPKTDDGQYAGHRWDPDGRLYWFNSRFYAPVIGQFMSPDADSRLLAGDSNPYEYAFENPLRWVDPDGHQSATPGGQSTANLGDLFKGLNPPAGLGNMLPTGIGNIGSFGGPTPNFGGGPGGNSQMNESPALAPAPPAGLGPLDTFLFASLGGHVPGTPLGGEIVVLSGVSENGVYVGVMVVGGIGKGNNLSAATYTGMEFTADRSGLHSEPISVSEVNLLFGGGGRYQAGGPGGESGSFGYVSAGGPIAVGVGGSDAAPGAFEEMLLRMVAPIGAFRSPRLGGFEDPY